MFTNRAAAHFDDICLTHFRNILKIRQKQSLLDHYFTKRTLKETGEGESEPKKAKENDDN